MKSRGRDHDRHRQALAEHGGGQIAWTNSRQHVVIKLQSLPACDIFPKRYLIERAAFVVITNIVRQFGPRCASIISNIEKGLVFHLNVR